MSAVVLSRPARRRRFVERQAIAAASLSRETCERHIARQVHLQMATMARKGISPELIAREQANLEAVLRAALWSAVLTPGTV
jgi:hypothetical protein